MKNIELTEDHKSKLLEMCTILFPEYNYNEKTGYGGWNIGENYSHSHLIGYLKNDFNDRIDDPDVYIHWFEFCMTHLANKMIELGELPNFNNKLDYDFFSMLQSSWWESHPIDYLYEEFKKLKL